VYPKFNPYDFCDECRVQKKFCTCFVKTPIEELTDIHKRINRLLKRLKKEERKV